MEREKCAKNKSECEENSLVRLFVHSAPRCSSNSTLHENSHPWQSYTRHICIIMYVKCTDIMLCSIAITFRPAPFAWLRHDDLYVCTRAIFHAPPSSVCHRSPYTVHTHSECTQTLTLYLFKLTKCTLASYILAHSSWLGCRLRCLLLDIAVFKYFDMQKC